MRRIRETRPFPNLRLIPHSGEIGVAGGGVEPQLDQNWDELTRLNWKAATVREATGVEIYVEDANYRIGRWKMPGRYNICYPGGVAFPFAYRECWSYLNGFESGARVAANR